MDKQYQPTLTEVQDWVLKLYNTCEQTITKAERLEQHKYVNPEKPDVPLNKNDAFQKVQKRRVQEKR